MSKRLCCSLYFALLSLQTDGFLDVKIEKKVSTFGKRLKETHEYLTLIENVHFTQMLCT